MAAADCNTLGVGRRGRAGSAAHAPVARIQATEGAFSAEVANRAAGIVQYGDPMNSVSETVIVAALRRGNLQRAMELILDTYQDELYAYCARLLGDADAVQVYQHVVTSALEQLTVFNGTPSVRAWLYAIARNMVIAFQRRHPGHFPGSASPDYVPVGVADNTTGLQLMDEQLDASLEDLEPRTLELLQLALWHGLLIAEVAHVVGCSEAEARRMASDGLTYVSMGLSRSGQTTPS